MHANGIEPLWSMLERAHEGTFRKFGPKHLDRVASLFSAGVRQQRKFDVPFPRRALLYYCACRAAVRRDSQSTNSSRQWIPDSAT